MSDPTASANPERNGRTGASFPSLRSAKSDVEACPARVRTPEHIEARPLLRRARGGVSLSLELFFSRFPEGLRELIGT